MSHLLPAPPHGCLVHNPAPPVSARPSNDVPAATRASHPLASAVNGPPPAARTVLQLVGPDARGILADITQLLMHNGCEVWDLHKFAMDGSCTLASSRIRGSAVVRVCKRAFCSCKHRAAADGACCEGRSRRHYPAACLPSCMLPQLHAYTAACLPSGRADVR